MWGFVGGVVGCGIICRIGYLVVLRSLEERKIDLKSSSVQKAMRSKEKLREKHLAGGAGAGKCSAPDLPEGQFLTKKWVVLDLGITPDKKVYDPWKNGDEFKIKVSGVEGGTKDFSVGEMKRLGGELKVLDWHCVTGWSYPGLRLTGVSMDKLIKAVKPREDWECLYQVSADGYTAPIMRTDLEADTGSFVALGDENGELLPMEHGGVRIVCPSLFGWKSAKYLTELHFLPHYEQGFWEKLGCHQRGRAMAGERWAPKAALTWDCLIWMADLYRIFLGPQVYWTCVSIGANTLGWFSKVFGLLTGYCDKKE